MDFERDTLTAVMEARAKALTATGPADAAQKEGQLTQALGRLIAVAENYPTLKSNDSVRSLMEELTGTENKVGFARQFYNDIATKFNTAQQVFPTNVFAAAFGFNPAKRVEELAGAASDEDKLKLQRLSNVVDEMAIAAGIPRPRVYVVPDADPNAFATGRGPGKSSIAVTRGLLDALDRDELQGVIAHEMSHIRNLDVRLMTIVAALVGTAALLSEWARRGMMSGGTRRGGSPGPDGGRGAPGR